MNKCIPLSKKLDKIHNFYEDIHYKINSRKTRNPE